MKNTNQIQQVFRLGHTDLISSCLHLPKPLSIIIDLEQWFLKCNWGHLGAPQNPLRGSMLSKIFL